MKERPILFSAPMVRALLAGTKTQTRRAVKPQPSEHHWQHLPGYELKHTLADLANGAHGVRFHHTIPQNREWDSDPWVKCPFYGQPGDRLWVREAFAFTDAHEPQYDGSIEYRADNMVMAVSGNDLIDVPHNCDPRPYAGPWKPGIHMPRWASRITLEITGVRVERLQDISEADALVEGIVHLADGGFGLPAGEHYHAADPRQSYLSLWEAINGPGSVEANPWVWAVEFRRLTT